MVLTADGSAILKVVVKALSVPPANTKALFPRNVPLAFIRSAGASPKLTTPFKVVIPSTSSIPLEFKFEKVPSAGVVPPITVLSITPALMVILSSTSVSFTTATTATRSVAVPVTKEV